MYMSRVSPVSKEAVTVLGEYVRAARLRRRWTVATLAERAGVSTQTISKIERGDPSVSIGTVFEAASLLDVELFGGQEGLAKRMVRRELALLPERGRSVNRTADNDF